jgi:hypothetical protein
MPIRKTMYRVSWLDENGQEIIDEVNRAAVDTPCCGMTSCSRAS